MKNCPKYLSFSAEMVIHQIDTLSSSSDATCVSDEADEAAGESGRDLGIEVSAGSSSKRSDDI
jgi:hypothetical protein